MINYHRPRLEDVVAGDGTIIGDPSFLLDFAIIGFGKCGTSTLMSWLGMHPELQCIQEEVWSLSFGKPGQLIKRMYKTLPEGHYKRGYKCPEDIRGDHVMRYYREMWPKAKLFVGVRHPISFFRSLYNFRVQNLKDMPHPNTLIGACTKGKKNTCTERGNYAIDLMRMGKTNANGPQQTTDIQEQIFGRHRKRWFNVTEIVPIPNDVFFFDMAQLDDTDERRSRAFRHDVQKFLGLELELPEIPHFTPGKKYDNETVQAAKDAKKIDICDDEFIPLRAELMRFGRLNSQWIRETFVKLPGVYVSSPDYLNELIGSWMRDPCENQTQPSNLTALVKAGEGSKTESRRLSTRPSLSELIDTPNGKIIGDPQFLLDFAIIGFGKCGTSTLMSWLGQHPEIRCIQDEVWALIWGKPYKLVKSLYTQLPEGDYVRGYKCPSDIKGPHVMEYFRSIWPKTKIFIGLRHPVFWFQSLYNFRVQNLNDPMPHPNTLIGVCTRGMKATCTAKGNFGLDLLRLGKQNMNGPRPISSLEDKILKRHRKAWFNSSEIQPLPNEIFIFDVAQLSEKNVTRSRQFRRAIQNFLGLKAELPDMVHHVPGKEWNETVQAKKDKLKINICDDEYLPLREALLEQGAVNADWLRHEFVHFPGVHISSYEQFNEILLGWKKDPCAQGKYVE